MDEMERIQRQIAWTDEVLREYRDEGCYDETRELELQLRALRDLEENFLHQIKLLPALRKEGRVF